jgi:citrate lyase beta subunit
MINMLSNDKLEEYAALAEQGPHIVLIPKEDIAALYREILYLREAVTGAYAAGVAEATLVMIETYKTCLRLHEAGVPIERDTVRFMQGAIAGYEGYQSALGEASKSADPL